MSDPSVSIVIPSYNGRAYLEECLPSLVAAAGPSREIMVVDNGSTDGSAAFIRQRYPQVRLLEIQENLGFAGANNLGAGKATGEWLLFLNNDTVVDPQFLQELLRKAEAHPRVGVWTSKIRTLSDPQRLDVIGSFLTLTGFLYHVGLLELDRGQHDHLQETFSVKGVSFLIRRSLFLELGGLDERFFAYFEETDLCWRVWLKGYSVGFAPLSIVYHKIGGTSSHFSFPFVDYHSFKNRIASLLKNLSGLRLVWMLPLHLTCCLGLVLVSLLGRRFGSSWAILKAIVWNIRSLPGTLRLRHQIQKSRRMSDSELFRRVAVPIPVGYFAKYVFWMVASRDKVRSRIHTGQWAPWENRLGTADVRPTPCPLCGSERSRSLLESRGWKQRWPHPFDLRECAVCGLIFLDPQPDEATLAAAYPEEYYAYDEHARELEPTGQGRMSRVRLYVREAVARAASQRKGWRRRLNPWTLFFGGRFAGFPTAPPAGMGSRLLDVGCGDGAFLDSARRLGWQVMGVEMSSAAVGRAQAAGLPVLQGTFETAPLTGSFQVIRMWHVLEHVRRPSVVLQRAHALLAPEGELILGLPNTSSSARRLCGVRWSAWDLPRHLFHFNPSSIRLQLEQSGFCVTRIDHRSVGTMLPSLAPRLASWVPFRILGIMADLFLDALRMGDSLEVRAKPVQKLSAARPEPDLIKEGILHELG